VPANRFGAARGIRTPDPIVTNDVIEIFKLLILQHFLRVIWAVAPRWHLRISMYPDFPEILVPQIGFEPTTPALRMRCSTS
jgi:hypothetical protein